MIDIDTIIAFETGQLGWQDTLEMFAELVKTKQAWSLQGSYGRFARSLIGEGWLSEDGEILKTILED
jgi:hypothetical protein